MLLFCRRRQGITLKCVPHVQHAYLSSFNQSNSCAHTRPNSRNERKGLAKLGNIVAETLFRMQMFPNLAARETCVAETNFAARSQKHFCFPDTNFASETYVFKFSHPGKHNKKIVSARMFPSLARP